MTSSTSVPALRRLTVGMTLAATVATQLALTPAQAASPQAGAGIVFRSKIALIHENLPLFSLAHAGAPTALVQSVLATLKAAPLAMNHARFVSMNEHGSVRAYVDPVNGDAAVFPEFSAAAQRSADLPHAALQTAAAGVFARGDMIPKDATTAKLGSETPVFASAQTKPGSKDAAAIDTAPRKLFTYVNTMRYAHGLPVIGKGSQAAVAVAGDGSIRGLVRRWQAASVAGTVVPTTTAAQVVASIDAQLHQYQTGNAQITVSAIRPAYYDGGAKYLQPVYGFMATIHGAGKAADDHVVGYVPVGKLVEPIPIIGAAQGSAPTQRAAASSSALRPNNNGTAITLGEYANDDGSMIDMANAYNNGYTANSPWWAPAIVRTQWYWAYPGDYVGASNYFANSVNIAYTNPHGNWWLNTTNGNNAGYFYISDIGTNGNPGYGAAAGGVLSTWIIDSCEVIPSMYDLQLTTGNGQNAFTPWFPVFQGLHRALGFRTEMLLWEDGMNYQIAYDQAQGFDAVSAYFSDIAAVDFHDIYGTYYDSNIGRWVDYDRASVMMDSRNGGESIYATYGQSAAGQLTNFWMGD